VRRRKRKKVGKKRRRDGKKRGIEKIESTPILAYRKGLGSLRGGRKVGGNCRKNQQKGITWKVIASGCSKQTCQRGEKHGRKVGKEREI